jgi:hypothetical protein
LDATFQLIQKLRAAPEAVRMEAIRSLPVPVLAAIWNRVGLKGKFGGDPDFSIYFHTVLLWRLFPKKYSEPVAPATPSKNSDPDLQWVVMSERAARGEALYHPDDAINLGADRGDDRLSRLVTNLRNGASVSGKLVGRVAS